jgi:uncharacterized protein
MNVRPLSLLETRVLGVMVEKQHTVPDSYPLSLNTLTLGCNQKTSRDPVMEASEADVQATLDALKVLDLAIESSGSRVLRYGHNFTRVYGVPSQAMALLTVLMLRGPQTLSELRINSERIHKFADISAVEGFMQELAAKAFVVELPRAPGAREPRWVHQLSGPVDVSQWASAASEPNAQRADIALSELATLKARVDALEHHNAALQRLIDRLCTELGVQP